MPKRYSALTEEAAGNKKAKHSEARLHILTIENEMQSQIEDLHRSGPTLKLVTVYNVVTDRCMSTCGTTNLCFRLSHKVLVSLLSLLLIIPAGVSASPSRRRFDYLF